MESESLELLELMYSLPPIKVINTNRYGYTTEYEEDHFGLKQGRLIEKDHRGNMISEAFYKDDKRNGIHTRWDYDYMAYKLTDSYENVPAVVRERANYTNGTLDGLYEKFYDSGTPHKRMTYMSGKIVGRIQVWDKEGNVQEDWEYPLEFPF